MAKDKPSEVLRSCRIGRRPLFFIGTFDSGVTVLSQQVRALNLIWALVESQFVRCTPRSGDKPIRVAIVGAGFAGMTAAGALLAKGANADITLFEERDTLLPLQLGSDSRWLHPRIYDWPAEPSQSSAAMLPILNWTAARASDVTVQILAEWKRSVEGHEHIALFCNTKHLQIQEVPEDLARLRIDWIGEERNPSDGTMATGGSVGKSGTFDLVLMAIGYGLERHGATSYWRNEVLGQPALDQPTQTYLVSGQGDGAFIDLLRLRISQYRQDRILDELFSGSPDLYAALKNLYRRFASEHDPVNMFDQFELLAAGLTPAASQFNAACNRLRQRLRRDTEVILRTRQQAFERLFDRSYARSSFQNKLLVYMLYKCGAFIPSSRKERLLIAEHSIPRTRIIRRHGTQRKRNFERILSPALFGAFLGKQDRSPISLTDEQKWVGGYFGFSGPTGDAPARPDAEKKAWRKEYLPGPTALVASAFCSALAGELAKGHPPDKRLRVTLHRAFPFGTEEVLQQTCEYQGLALEHGLGSSVGRTFPARNATIGLAYSCREIVRSTRSISRKALREAMDTLNLNEASSAMAADVAFIMAIPLLEPEDNFTSPTPVSGIIYVDSKADGYYIDDQRLLDIVSVVQSFLDGITTRHEIFGGIRNIFLSPPGSSRTPRGTVPARARRALELVSKVRPPSSTVPFQFNFDYSDFVPTS